MTFCSFFDSASRPLAGRWRPFWLATLLLAGCAGSVPGSRTFDLQAHRGGRGLAPENTLAAFSQAAALGVDTLELDIGLSADDVVVVSHDTRLNPDHTRDARGQWLQAQGAAIRSLTVAQLQTYDVGRLNPATAYGRQFATQQPRDGERIPTLAQLFARMQAQGATRVRFNIETKIDPTKPDETAAPEPMVRALLAEIERAGVASRVTVQSFDWRTLALVGRLAPQLPRAYLTSARTLRDSRWTAGRVAADFGSTPRLVKAAAGAAAGPVVWSPAFADLTPEALREAHALGLAVLPWTVNQRADMARLMDWGVDGLITDYPDVLRSVMAERGRPLPPGVPAR
ncbi:MAG: glycerophosphodiester phosphodiesterase [Proteobacteria bacterium]|nr:glycerophosphodiester phosphodiesterase [Pseudomonadota bacterium]